MIYRGGMDGHLLRHSDAYARGEDDRGRGWEICEWCDVGVLDDDDDDHGSNGWGTS